MADYADQGGGSAAGAAIELEHAIGFGGGVSAGLHYHPNGKDLLYAAGGCVVVCDFNDPHNQVFLRGHDDDITTLALSRYVCCAVSLFHLSCRFDIPVFIDDTITATATVKEKLLKKGGAMKLLIIETIVTNQDDVVVTEGEATIMVM